MGLDMYLHSRKNGEVMYWRKANAIHRFFEQHVANGYLENCERVRVPKRAIKELYSRCKQVKESLDAQEKETVQIMVGNKYKTDPETGERAVIPVYSNLEVYTNTDVAKNLLPPQNGFFFGDTRIDEYYYQNIIDTMNMCKKILTDPAFKGDVLEYLAWW